MATAGSPAAPAWPSWSTTLALWTASGPTTVSTPPATPPWSSCPTSTPPPSTRSPPSSTTSPPPTADGHGPPRRRPPATPLPHQAQRSPAAPNLAQPSTPRPSTGHRQHLTRTESPWHLAPQPAAGGPHPCPPAGRPARSSRFSFDCAGLGSTGRMRMACNVAAQRVVRVDLQCRAGRMVRVLLHRAPRPSGHASAPAPGPSRGSSAALPCTTQSRLRDAPGVAVKRLVEYRIGPEGTQTVVVEVDEPLEETGEERAGLLSWKSPKPASENLEESFDRITPAANLLMSKLRGLAERPDEATIEFGVKLTGTAGAVLASAGVEANF